MSDKVAHSRGHGTAVRGFVNVDLSGLDSLFEVCGDALCCKKLPVILHRFFGIDDFTLRAP